MAGPGDTRRARVAVGLLVAAGGAAWVALVGFGPDEIVVPPRVELPGEVAPPPSEVPVVDRLPTPPAPTPIDPPGPPPTGLPPSGIPVVQVGEPGPPTDPDVAERIRAATADALARRLEMIERMFDAAPLAVVDEADRGRVAAVLDQALDQMRGVEDDLASGTVVYREAVERMDAIRDAAAARIDGLVSEDEAAPVKLRMGIRPPPDPAEAQPWEGVPFEQGFQDWK